MCFVQLHLSWTQSISRQDIFQLLLKVMKCRLLHQTQWFPTRFLPVIWKRSLVLFIDPEQSDWADSSLTDWMWRSQGFCWGFAFPSIYTNITPETVFYPLHANLDAKWLPIHSPLPPELCKVPAVTMPLQAPLCDQFGSQLCSMSVVIIRVNVISFTCSIGKYLWLLPLAINFPKFSVLWHQLHSQWVEGQLCEESWE